MSDELGYQPAQVVTTADEVLRLLGEPMESQVKKVIDHIDDHCRAWIERSPFVVIDHLIDLRFHWLPEHREDLVRRPHDLFRLVPRFITHTTSWQGHPPLATTTELTAAHRCGTTMLLNTPCSATGP